MVVRPFATKALLKAMLVDCVGALIPEIGSPADGSVLTDAELRHGEVDDHSQNGPGRRCMLGAVFSLNGTWISSPCS